ncbi:hypothetical protein F4775DRAFT_588686 [Biscogniauxia sp. FL1348]|nr:hypothetical protein F4775DRAFT_588686 [Biscogniauxia sp. FL1348]
MAAFRIWQNSTQMSQFVVLVLLTPLGILVTLLRFVAIQRASRRPGLEDWLSAAATVFFITTNLWALKALSILNGRQIAEEIRESPEVYKHVHQWVLASVYSCFAHMLFVKLGVLALYYRIFGVRKTYRIWVYVLAGLQTLVVVMFCIFRALLCRPIEEYFDRAAPGHCEEDALTIILGETPNSLLDFAMVILAVFMIRSLQLSTAMKWKLGILFGLGALVGIIGFIKIPITYSTETLYAFSMVFIWTSVQMFVSLLCCCLPVYSPILPTAAFWSRMLSYVTLGHVSGVRSQAHWTKWWGNGRRHHASGKTPQGWKHLEENSTRGLAWPQATHHAEVHTLSDFTTQSGYTGPSGIQVQRQVHIV